MDAKGMTQPIDENKLADDWWDALEAFADDATIRGTRAAMINGSLPRARLLAATWALIAASAKEVDTTLFLTGFFPDEIATELLPDRED